MVDISDTVEITQIETVGAETLSVVATRIDVAVTTESLTVVQFGGTCQSCAEIGHEHELKSGFIGIPTEMLPIFIDQLQKCYRRVIS